MYKKKTVALVLCVMVLSTACGSEKVETEASIQEAQETEQAEEVEGTTEEQNEQGEMDDDTAPEENTEIDTNSKENGTEEADNQRFVIGTTKLEDICAAYDKVLSTYALESYFGYNIPDGWTGDDTWSVIDGRQEERYIDQWTSGTETITIRGICNDGSVVVSMFDENGNEYEPQTDIYDYDNRYYEALHEFCETEEWKEPERAKLPSGSSVDYCTDRIFRGNIDTPYGKGTLCTAVYEIVFYKNYDEEKHCYTEVDHTEGWIQKEEMVLEIDDYFVIMEYNNGDWYSPNGAPTNLEYTGRLDEVIPQMF